MPQNNRILNLKPIQKFTQGLGKKVENYFGQDKSCIIGLEDDGVFYAQGLYHWFLQKKKRNISFTTMDDTGAGLEGEKARGRKVLLVDNDIVTGTAFHRAMNYLIKRKEALGLQEIKFAVLCDRLGVADFFLEQYPSPSLWNIKDLDGIDLSVIKALSQDGRKSFVDIAKDIGLTAVGIKKRVERLLKKDMLKIQAFLNTEKFYTTSARVGIEADSATISRLIKKLEKCPLVYNLVKVSGHHNLLIGLLAPEQKRITDLIEKQIRSEPKIRYIEVNFGELPIVPRVHFLPHFIEPSTKCLCQKKCNECEYF